MASRWWMAYQIPLPSYSLPIHPSHSEIQLNERSRKNTQKNMRKSLDFFFHDFHAFPAFFWAFFWAIFGPFSRHFYALFMLYSREKRTKKFVPTRSTRTNPSGPSECKCHATLRAACGTTGRARARAWRWCCTRLAHSPTGSSLPASTRALTPR